MGKEKFIKYKSTVKVGIDETTLVLLPNEKVHPDEWIIKAEEMLGNFINLSKLEDLSLIVKIHFMFFEK